MPIGKQKARRIRIAVAGWTCALAMAFPIFWMVLTAFKTEIAAVATPPSVFFSPTLENFFAVNARANYFAYASNSVIESFGATAIALVVAIPAAYAAAFFPSKHTKNLLLWMLSTKMLPAVGVLVPIYLLGRNTGLLDTRTGLVVVFTL